MLARSIAVGALVLGGCYEVPQPVCGFACASEATVCPDGYTCNSNDNRCHLVGYTTADCKDVPADPNNGPQIITFQPTSNVEPIDTAITVQFDREVEHVAEGSFLVTDDSTGMVFPTHPVAPDSPTTWSLFPTSSFSFGARYTVHLTTEITDPDGRPFEGLIYGFGIVGDPPPSVDFANFIQPAPGEGLVPVDTLVTVTMTETVMTLSGKFHLVDQFTGLEVPTTIDNTGFTAQATLDPDEQLLPQRTYLVLVDGDVMDINGNSMVNVGNWTFTTGDDLVAPQLRETTPKANSIADVGSSIRILFDEPVNSIGTFAVSSGGTPIAGAPSPSSGGRVWTFQPISLPANAVISVALTDIADFSGNVRDFAFNFMTAP